VTWVETIKWFIVVAGGCWALAMMVSIWSHRASDRSINKLIAGIDDVRRRTGGEL